MLPADTPWCLIFLRLPVSLKMSILIFQLAIFILVAGILCIYINYDCDRQRQEFRQMNGKCLVWGKPPSKVWSYGIYIMVISDVFSFRCISSSKINIFCWTWIWCYYAFADRGLLYHHYWRNKNQPSFNIWVVSFCSKYCKHEMGFMKCCSKYLPPRQEFKTLFVSLRR